jgi:alpha-tubulin suppressor-like RCC1 family protein
MTESKGGIATGVILIGIVLGGCGTSAAAGNGGDLDAAMPVESGIGSLGDGSPEDAPASDGGAPREAGAPSDAAGGSDAAPSEAGDAGSASGVTAIAAGTFHSCAIVDGGAACWGYNASGQLGNGSFADSLVPVPVSGLSGEVTAIAVADELTCAVVDGAAKCWGYNGGGESGSGSIGDSSQPLQVLRLTSGVTAIATQYRTSCAIVSGGVQCWSDFNGPSPIPGISGATAIAVGSYHACALVGGAVQCWGLNTVGQLGDGTNKDSNVPVQVQGITGGATAIAAGPEQSCAVVNQAARCWGYNANGLLGGGSVTNGSNVPIPVVGLPSGASVTSISTGALHTCALADGSVWCWGSDTKGQLGNGVTMTQSLTPLQAQGVATPTSAVSAGGAYTCALAGGKVQCWGFNSSGQLGDDSTTDSLTPVSPVL